MNKEDLVNDNVGLMALGIFMLFVLLIGFAAWMVMLGYPQVVEIVMADGQEVVNNTISYIDSLVLLLALFLLNGGPLAVLKVRS